MKTAWCVVPDRFEDGRHEAIRDGLKRHGYSLVDGAADVAVTWNLHTAQARQARDACAQVVVFEEGYTRGLVGEKYFAAALGDHGGAGVWPDGGPERFERFGLELEPWRDNRDGYILAVFQRGIGSELMAQPPAWPQKVVSLLRETGRLVVERPRPRKGESAPDLVKQIEGACCVVLWGSGVGVRALTMGVPVLYAAAHNVLDGAALRLANHLGALKADTLSMPDRLPAFQRMAWAQWTLGEIRSGETFEALL